jgi:hypothetical protein
VPYSLQYSEELKEQLRTLAGLSREGRVKLYANLHHSLAVVPDGFRSDPDNRDPSGASRFLFRVLLMDAGRVRQFQFAVNDSAAQYGVLQILSVEDLSLP